MKASPDPSLGSMHARSTSDRPLDPLRAAALAERALAEQREEEALDIVLASAAHHRNDPRLWQWAALLHRALDDRIAAIAAYQRAAVLAPGDVSVLHGLARTRWEAGLPSLDDYARASKLAPYDGDVLLGTAAAQVAAGDLDGALARIEQVLALEPRWIEGQRQAAHLRFMAGEADTLTRGVEKALDIHPRDEALWRLLLSLVQQMDAGDRITEIAAKAVLRLGDRPFITVARAVAASEAGDRAVADAAFATLSALDDPSVAVHRIRHLLRTGRPAEAGGLLDIWLDRPGAATFYPYAAIAWRLTGDARAGWLQGSRGQVGVFDLAPCLPPLERLAATLRRLHHGGGQPLDQSVRGGSQTDGILLASIDPDIQQTRRAIVAAVDRYVAALPPVDIRHPTLSPRRDRRPRFAGSWSVRLRGGGHHASHVHPAGWISSALYVALPPVSDADRSQAGWLTVGEPPADIGGGLGAQTTIEPKPGRLVLFPSTTWHGTRPFAQGERLTIAFDIAPPLP